MTNVPDNGALFVAMAGLMQETDFWKEVQRYGCRTLEEFYRWAEKYICKDNSREAVKKNREDRSSSEKEKNTKSRKRKDESSQNALVEPKKQQAEDIQWPHPFISQFNYYTNLNASREHIYMT